MAKRSFKNGKWAGEMTDGFAKIYTSMLRSSVWVGQSKEKKILWVTMLALANGQGYVASSIPGLARDAELTLDETLTALEQLKEPDKWSRSKEEEGRRIVEVDGGWRIINHRKYREMRSAKQVAHAEAQKRYEAKRKGNKTDPPELREHADGITGKSPRIRKVSAIRADATDAQKQKQKQRDPPEQVGSDPTPGGSLVNVDFKVGGSIDLTERVRARELDPPPLRALRDPLEADPGLIERLPPVVASRTVPNDWQPKEHHPHAAQLAGLDFATELATFRATEFKVVYSDWDKRFDRWLIDRKTDRETSDFKRLQQGPPRNGSFGGLRLQPDHGVTGFEGVTVHSLSSDPDGESL